MIVVLQACPFSSVASLLLRDCVRQNGRSSPQKMFQHSAKMLVGQMPFLSNRSLKIEPTWSALITPDVGSQADILSSLMDAAFQMAPGAEHVAALLVDAQGARWVEARWVEATHAAEVVGVHLRLAPSFYLSIGTQANRETMD